MSTAAEIRPAGHPDGAVTVEQQGHILLIGINRPEKYNGLTPKIFDEIAQAYMRLEEEDDLWIGVLFAHGPHFTAGLDLPKFINKFRDDDDMSARDGQIDIYHRIGRKRTKPLIAAIQGICYTAGIEMALAADMVIAASDVRMAMLEPKRGLLPSGGAIMRYVARSGWGNAMRWLLTAAELDAEEAKRIGLVQEVVTPGEQLQRAIALAEEIAEVAPLATRAIIDNGYRYLEDGEEDASRDAIAKMSMLSRTEDAEEGVQSFKERRKANFQGK